MADHKTDDTTPPLARRGARPFAGPAGAPGGPRPFTRPAATQRPTAAPFAPPVVPGRRTLGNAPPPDTRPSAAVATQPVPSATDEAPTSQPRPVTSEMVAVDAIDAFDAVWDTAETSMVAVEPAALPSPSEPVSLGTETDNHVLAEAITTESDFAAPKPSAAQTATTAGSIDTTPAATMPAWLKDEPTEEAAPGGATAPDRPEPEVDLVADDVSSTPDAAWSATAIEMGSVVGEWTDAHTIPSSDEIMGLAPESTAPTPAAISLGDATRASTGWTGDEVNAPVDAEPRFELIEEETPDTAAPAAIDSPTADLNEPRHARVAAALDRLAERVQSGEIDVSSIAPDATDAAILASILAALLGGSHRR